MAGINPPPPIESVMSSSMLKGRPRVFELNPALPNIPTCRATCPGEPMPNDRAPSEGWLLDFLGDGGAPRRLACRRVGCTGGRSPAGCVPGSSSCGALAASAPLRCLAVSSSWRLCSGLAYAYRGLRSGFLVGLIAEKLLLRRLAAGDCGSETLMGGAGGSAVSAAKGHRASSIRPAAWNGFVCELPLHLLSAAYQAAQNISACNVNSA